MDVISPDQTGFDVRFSRRWRCVDSISFETHIDIPGHRDSVTLELRWLPSRYRRPTRPAMGKTCKFETNRKGSPKIQQGP